ncbi:hypothetical protein [Ancylobacter oerskovii]|uniref:Uncharacterized protein n=1 Tax=Ancylobacter oerskovii TaxID=459519 RepID=A0ABW4YY46_9HYPH|nr:hypothetical protein [Ancylobacter oerskovii]MBS7541820.1 hypothetical protein [Ancylobacter oerskovii]
MVILRVALLALAAGAGLVLGWPAQTSQPAGFATPAPAPRAAAPAMAMPPLPGAVQDEVRPAPAPQISAPQVSTPQASPPQVSARPDPAVQVPPAPVLLALLRSTLAAVNQANVTGNYSVLRDLGAPAFRENYNAAQLADQFRPWRDNALDFAAILLLDAKLSQPPAIDGNGLLRLKGYFPTAPLRIGFDLGFAATADNWRLATISVDASKSEAGPEAAPLARPAAPVPAPAKIAAGHTQPPAAPAPRAAPGQPAPFDMGPLRRAGTLLN